MVFAGSGSDSAGFVQIIKDSDADQEQLRAFDAAFEPHAPQFRPDLLGGIRVWTGPRSYVEAAYFTSEDEARANESNEPPPELDKEFAEFRQLMAGAEFLDFTDPMLNSA